VNAAFILVLALLLVANQRERNFRNVNWALAEANGQTWSLWALGTLLHPHVLASMLLSPSLGGLSLLNVASYASSALSISCQLDNVSGVFL